MEDHYYSTVYSWFDKCGIISNIRTHLRQNLVNALKNKDLSLQGDNDAPKSAKQYVYDLLIAEYLFDRNYAYTLSVFASEAPLLVNFAKQVSLKSDGSKNKQRLQNDYVVHTLETLGIKPSGREGRFIVSKYSESEEPLLLCVLHCLGLIYPNAEEKEEKRERKESKSFREAGTQTERVDDSSEVKLSDVRKRLLQQKEAYDVQLMQKEEKLREQVIAVDRQLLALQKKLEEAQNLLHTVEAKEIRFVEEQRREEQRIYQRDMELSMKEKLLSQEADRLDKERNSYRQFEADLKKLQEELTKVKKELPSSERSSSRDMHVQTDFESYTVFCRQNQELSSLVSQQQARIEHLTLRAVRLSRQLEEAQLSKTHMLATSTPAPKVKSNTIFSESSSTDDLLHDAKIRLKRLEEESSKADQYYYSYIASSG